MTKEEKMDQIKLSFENLAQLFEVLGDQNRQHLIYTLFSLPCKSKGGVRVGEITEKTPFSTCCFTPFKTTETSWDCRYEKRRY